MSESPILISCGTCDITPRKPVPLFGYAHRRGNFTRVDSELEGNAVLFAQGDRRILLMQIDSLFPGNRLQSEIESRLTSPCDLLLVASHTHFAPSLDPSKAPLGGFDDDYFAFVTWQLASLANRVLHDSPGEATCFKSSADCNAAVFRRKRWLTVKRTFPFLVIETAMLPNTAVEIDPTLSILSIFDAQGQVISVIWNWACHPTASPHPYSVSSDYVGTVRSRIREAFGSQIPVVFLPGFMGDIRPRILADQPQWNQRLWNPCAPEYFGLPTPKTYARFCDSIVNSIALDQHHPERACPLVGNLALTRISCPFDRIMRLREPPRNTLPLALLRLNDHLHFAFIGAEPSTHYVRKVRKILGDETIPVGYFQDVYGYLPVERQISEGGYEVSGFLTAFNLDGDFAPGFEQAILESISAGIDRNAAV